MREIILTKGQVALVDDADFDWLSQWKWYAQANNHGGFYAARRGPDRRLVYMHRIINDTPDDAVTDHRDGNGLNNRRANLRTATQLQNMMNRYAKRDGSSSLKGVWFDRHMSSPRPWRAAIRLNGKLKYLGRYSNEADAASAYEVAAKQHFGEFARSGSRT